MNSGDPQFDSLLAADPSVQPLCMGMTALSVAYLQQLLRGHGYQYLPDPRVSGYANYGSATARAVSDYRKRHGLAVSDKADTALLRDLIQRPAPRATVGPAYNTLVLDVPFTSTTRFVWLTSLFETSGMFSQLNLNTDQCGLSFGVLQWTQKSGQLHEFLNACAQREPREFTRIMGALPDAKADLTKEPWKTRFIALGSSLPIQRVQLAFSEESYNSALKNMQSWLHPEASERTIAFLLDLANQFGPRRVAQHYQQTPSLKDLEDEFTALSRPQYQPQVRARREFFRTTPLLSDNPPC